MALDIITEYLFGYSVNVQQPPERSHVPNSTDLPDPRVFVEGVDQWVKVITSAAILGKWYKYVPDPRFTKVRSAMCDYVDWFVSRRLRHLRSGPPAAAATSRLRPS